MDTNKHELTRSKIPKSFFQAVRSILPDARQRAYAAVNFIMVEAYWKIGRRIVKEEQGGKSRAEYGAYLIKELSRNLGNLIMNLLMQMNQCRGRTTLFYVQYAAQLGKTCLQH